MRVDLGVAGPTPQDMARAFLSIRADPLGFLVDTRQRYGDLVAFPVPGSPVLLASDPADVRHVLQTAGRDWGKHTLQYAALARVTGPGLLASAEPSWIRHRRAAAPAFHHQRLERVADQVRAAADDAVTARFAGPSRVVDVSPVMMRIALDAVGRTLFSTDLSGQGRQLLRASSRAASLVVQAGRAVLPVPEWAPTPLNLRLRSTRRRLDAASAALVTQRRREGAPGDPDLLDLLLASGLPDEQVRHELVTMVVAGHETVAAGMAWTLMLLAEHPAAQDRVRAELAGHDGPAPLLGQAEALPFTRAVVDEALRLFPPAWAISRRSTQPDVVGGREVPVGTTVIVSPWLLHRDAASWDDPTTFRPERFLDGAPRPAYLPFGLGPHLCIGRELALGEMVLVLARVLATHRLGLPAGWTRPRPEARVTVRPHGGSMPLQVSPL